MTPDLAQGSRFAGHRIDGLLGRGGMGAVYRATHEESGEPVALKLIVPELGSDPTFRDRFEREARILAGLDHPHIVPLRKTGAFEGIAYMAMALVDGTDLDAVIAMSEGIHPAHAAAVVGQVASALDAAHERGLVHRDVKPGNVLLERRGPDVHAWLTDFGLSRHRSSVSGLTKTGHWVGTIDYAAPEQLQALAVDSRADVYALGCLLHKALTGEVPFARARDVSKLMAHLTEAPPRPSLAGRGVPAGFDAVVGQALAKQPGERFESAGQLAAAALAAAADAGPAARPLLYDAPPAPAGDADGSAPTAA